MFLSIIGAVSSDNALPPVPYAWSTISFSDATKTTFPASLQMSVSGRTGDDGSLAQVAHRDEQLNNITTWSTGDLFVAGSGETLYLWNGGVNTDYTIETVFNQISGSPVTTSGFCSTGTHQPTRVGVSGSIELAIPGGQIACTLDIVSTYIPTGEKRSGQMYFELF